jgi:hypothetical protein
LTFRKIKLHQYHLNTWFRIYLILFQDKSYQIPKLGEWTKPFPIELKLANLKSQQAMLCKSRQQFDRIRRIFHNLGAVTVVCISWTAETSTKLANFRGGKIICFFISCSKNKRTHKLLVIANFLFWKQTIFRVPRQP